MRELPEIRIQVFEISRQNGCWKWIRGTRRFMRVCLIDASKGVVRGWERCRSTIDVLYETSSYDDATNRRPTAAYNEAISEAKAIAKKRKLPLVVNNRLY